MDKNMWKIPGTPERNAGSRGNILIVYSYLMSTMSQSTIFHSAFR